MGLLRTLLISVGARLRCSETMWVGGVRYLTRYTLAERGKSKLYLHRFHQSDSDPELHSHPWSFAVSFVLVGGYSEERRREDGTVRRRTFGPGSLNFLRASDCHRIDLLDGEAWTLFLVGPKAHDWGFWNRETKAWVPWRTFVQAREENPVYRGWYGQPDQVLADN